MIHTELRLSARVSSRWERTTVPRSRLAARNSLNRWPARSAAACRSGATDRAASSASRAASNQASTAVRWASTNVRYRCRCAAEISSRPRAAAVDASSASASASTPA